MIRKATTALALASMLFSQFAHAVTLDQYGNVALSADAQFIFGEMIPTSGPTANPWGYASERVKAFIDNQVANQPYLTQGMTWTTPATGTVAYPFFSNGFGPSGGTCTTTSADITASATSIPVTDATCLDLSVLPTHILIAANKFTTPEDICISGKTGTTGAQTLSVCYDGRGISGAPGSFPLPLSAQIWPSGSTVGQLLIKGTGTSFISDGVRPICPAGAGGAPGAVVYSTGTVRLTNSTTVTGTGAANWTVGNGVFAQENIVIAGTHGGGTPFVADRLITVVGSTTSLTVDHALPADVDTGVDFTYKILSVRYVSLEFTDTASGAPHNGIFNVFRCESETLMAATLTLDTSGIVQSQTARRFSYKDVLDAQSTFGNGFYSYSLAAHAYCLQSGYAPACNFYATIDDAWIRDPEMYGGFAGTSSPLLIGGGIVAAIARLQLDSGSTTLTWPDVRHFIQQGVTGFYGSGSACNVGDVRDTSWVESIVMLGAKFDPDMTYNATWVGSARAWATRDANCSRTAAQGYGKANGGASDSELNSYATSDLFGLVGPSLTANGTDTLTGTGLVAAALCRGNGYGTISVTPGSYSATIISSTVGTPSTSDLDIWIDGSGGTPSKIESFQYAASGSAITLASPWQGQASTFPYMTESQAQGYTETALGNVDGSTDTAANNHKLQRNWACYTVDDTHLKLHTAFGVPSGSGYHLFSYSLAGFKSQPYMMGIKAMAQRWGTLLSDSTAANAFQALIDLPAIQLVTYGYDPYTQGTVYDDVTEKCADPGGAPNPSPTFVTRRGLQGPDGSACGLTGLKGPEIVGEYPTRTYSAEAMHSYVHWFLSAPSMSRLAFVDKVYGSIYGKCSLTQGVYCDAYYINEANELYVVGSLYKWTGYFFGAGMAHYWPAVRRKWLAQQNLVSVSSNNIVGNGNQVQ